MLCMSHFDPTLHLRIRQAMPEDASFIARHVLEALHWGMYELPLSAEQETAWRELTELCRRDDVLYSHRYAQIAEWDGQPIGLLIRYPGADYRRLRSNTFPRLSAFRGTDPETMADETTAGEYYIDSLAVAPSHRGRGVAEMLLRTALTEAADRGLMATLLVDPDNPPALRLYGRVGFVADGTIFAFGQLYMRMIIP